jgi:hypothetical protein
MNNSIKSQTDGGLIFKGMSDLGILKGFNLDYHVRDATLDLFLCVGKTDNRVKINKTTPLTRQSMVLKSLDELGKWGVDVELWMTAEKNGIQIAKTAPVKYKNHVKPYYGTLMISDIASDDPKMTYPGNGKGRLLSKAINNRYYFIYGGKLEDDEKNRGFDCTSFPMALFSIPKLTLPGYGKQVCEAVNAAQCGLEQQTSEAMAQLFKNNTIPVGLYMLFSAGHVMLYDSYKNMLHEFNFGGFKSTYAAHRSLKAPQNLWWMRKLPESYRSAFN